LRAAWCIGILRAGPVTGSVHRRNVNKSTCRLTSGGGQVVLGDDLWRDARIAQQWLALGSRMAGTALVCLLLSSCNSTSVELHPVRGKVLLDGQPIGGAKVILQPAGQFDPTATNPFGTTAADGSFELSTYPQGEGVPAGEYVALLMWIPADAAERADGFVPNKLPAKYANRDTSPFRVTVKAGANELEPFQLSK
jgi:hypothetical protein